MRRNRDTEVRAPVRDVESGSILEELFASDLSIPAAEGETFASESQQEFEVIGLIDSRHCVSDTTVMPFRFICSLDILGGPGCSGTLIGPRTVLTAGHCINDITPKDLRVIPARRGTTRPPFGSAQAVAFHLPPGQRDVTATDYGVVILGQPIGMKMGWWTFDHFRGPGDSVGTSVLKRGLPLPPSKLRVNISGYPCDLPKDRLDPCFDPKRDLRGLHQYHAFDQAVQRTRATPAGILEYLNDTFNCMSGSPVWIKRHPNFGGRVLVAIHISGDDSGTPIQANTGVLVQGSVREFVRAHSFSPPSTTPPGRPQVRRGSRGTTVRELQYRLNIWIAITPSARLADLAVDGIFGPRTQAGARGFQRAKHLVVDAIVGPKTWRRLQLPF